MQTQEYFRGAFLEWMDAIKANKASCRDRVFIDAHNQQSPTAYLLSSASASQETLPADHAWIVADYPALIGKNAERTYKNAQRVVRARRQQ